MDNINNYGKGTQQNKDQRKPYHHYPEGTPGSSERIKLLRECYINVSNDPTNPTPLKIGNVVDYLEQKFKLKVYVQGTIAAYLFNEILQPQVKNQLCSEDQKKKKKWDIDLVCLTNDDKDIKKLPEIMTEFIKDNISKDEKVIKSYELDKVKRSYSGCKLGQMDFSVNLWKHFDTLYRTIGDGIKCEVSSNSFLVGSENKAGEEQQFEKKDIYSYLIQGVTIHSPMRQAGLSLKVIFNHFWSVVTHGIKFHFQLIAENTKKFEDKYVHEKGDDFIPNCLMELRREHILQDKGVELNEIPIDEKVAYLTCLLNMFFMFPCVIRNMQILTLMLESIKAQIKSIIDSPYEKDNLKNKIYEMASCISEIDITKSTAQSIIDESYIISLLYPGSNETNVLEFNRVSTISKLFFVIREYSTIEIPRSEGKRIFLVLPEISLKNKNLNESAFFLKLMQKPFIKTIEKTDTPKTKILNLDTGWQDHVEIPKNVDLDDLLEKWKKLIGLIVEANEDSKELYSHLVLCRNLFVWMSSIITDLKKFDTFKPNYLKLIYKVLISEKNIELTDFELPFLPKHVIARVCLEAIVKNYINNQKLISKILPYLHDHTFSKEHSKSLLDALSKVMSTHYKKRIDSAERIMLLDLAKLYNFLPIESNENEDFSEALTVLNCILFHFEKNKESPSLPILIKFYSKRYPKHYKKNRDKIIEVEKTCAKLNNQTQLDNFFKEKKLEEICTKLYQEPDLIKGNLDRFRKILEMLNEEPQNIPLFIKLIETHKILFYPWLKEFFNWLQVNSKHIPHFKSVIFTWLKEVSIDIDSSTIKCWLPMLSKLDSECIKTQIPDNIATMSNLILICLKQSDYQTSKFLLEILEKRRFFENKTACLSFIKLALQLFSKADPQFYPSILELTDRWVDLLSHDDNKHLYEIWMASGTEKNFQKVVEWSWKESNITEDNFKILIHKALAINPSKFLHDILEIGISKSNNDNGKIIDFIFDFLQKQKVDSICQNIFLDILVDKSSNFDSRELENFCVKISTYKNYNLTRLVKSILNKGEINDFKTLKKKLCCNRQTYCDALSEYLREKLNQRKVDENTLTFMASILNLGDKADSKIMDELITLMIKTKSDSASYRSVIKGHIQNSDKLLTWIDLLLGNCTALNKYLNIIDEVIVNLTDSNSLNNLILKLEIEIVKFKYYKQSSSESIVKQIYKSIYEQLQSKTNLDINDFSNLLKCAELILQFIDLKLAQDNSIEFCQKMLEYFNFFELKDKLSAYEKIVEKIAGIKDIAKNINPIFAQSLFVYFITSYEKPPENLVINLFKITHLSTAPGLLYLLNNHGEFLISALLGIDEETFLNTLDIGIYPKYENEEYKQLYQVLTAVVEKNLHQFKDKNIPFKVIQKFKKTSSKIWNDHSIKMVEAACKNIKKHYSLYNEFQIYNMLLKEIPSALMGMKIEKIITPVQKVDTLILMFQYCFVLRKNQNKIPVISSTDVMVGIETLMRLHINEAIILLNDEVSYPLLGEAFAALYFSFCSFPLELPSDDERTEQLYKLLDIAAKGIAIPSFIVMVEKILQDMMNNAKDEDKLRNCIKLFDRVVRLYINVDSLHYTLYSIKKAHDLLQDFLNSDKIKKNSATSKVTSEDIIKALVSIFNLMVYRFEELELCYGVRHNTLKAINEFSDVCYTKINDKLYIKPGECKVELEHLNERDLNSYTEVMNDLIDDCMKGIKHQQSLHKHSENFRTNFSIWLDSSKVNYWVNFPKVTFKSFEKYISELSSPFKQLIENPKHASSLVLEHPYLMNTFFNLAFNAFTKDPSNPQEAYSYLKNIDFIKSSINKNSELYTTFALFLSHLYRSNDQRYHNFATEVFLGNIAKEMKCLPDENMYTLFMNVICALFEKPRENGELYYRTAIDVCEKFLFNSERCHKKLWIQQLAKRLDVVISQSFDLNKNSSEWIFALNSIFTFIVSITTTENLDEALHTDPLIEQINLTLSFFISSIKSTTELEPELTQFLTHFDDMIFRFFDKTLQRKESLYVKYNYIELHYQSYLNQRKQISDSSDFEKRYKKFIVVKK